MIRSFLVRSGPRARRNRREDQLVRVVAAASLRPDSRCVDIGANQGQLLSTFTDIAAQGRHLAFEPVPALASWLAQRFPQVDVRQVALANDRGQTSFVVHTALPSRSSLRAVGYSPGETERITVEMDRLDDALPAGYVPDLIKIDVEGAELLVLEGAVETLERSRPLILFEHQRETARHYGVRTADLWGLLNGFGYRIFDMEGRGPYTQAGLEDAVLSGHRWNFLAKARA
jgi:FkbM family methyltransferase